jgi:hypothetical protein
MELRSCARHTVRCPLVLAQSVPKIHATRERVRVRGSSKVDGFYRGLVYA